MANILLISHCFAVTGAPNSLLRQAKYFRKAGHNVEVWSLGDGGLKERYSEEGFNPVILENNVLSIQKYYEERKKHFDFVLCNTIVTYKVILALHKYNIPTVWFIRETKMLDDYMQKDIAFAKLFTEFDNLYTVSEYAASVIKKYNKNVKIIHNAIFDNQKDKPLNQNNAINFGYIGSIIEIKGVEILINAFKDILKTNSDINLFIAGNASWNEYGRKLTEQTSDIKNIKWLGEIQKEEKEEFFDNIDILCVPSLDDPCPLTVIEGAMRSKAIITTKNTGSNFIVEENNSGYIVETGNVSAFKEAMEKTLNSDILKMKKCSRKQYEIMGTTEREEKEVLKMLQDTLNKGINTSDKIINVSKKVLQYEKEIKNHNTAIRLLANFVFPKNKRIEFKKRHTRTIKSSNAIFIDTAKKINKYDIAYSLGRDCYCAMYLDKANLRITSGPFDWLTNADFQTRINLILNDFKDFFNKEDFKLMEKDPNVINDDKNDYYENTKNNFYYYHDFPANESFEAAFREAKQKYERRIERFYNNLKNKKHILLVWFSTIPYTDNENLIKQAKALCKKFNKKIDFLIIEHDENKKLGDIERTQISSNIVKYALCTHVSYKNIDSKQITERLEEIVIPIYKKYKLKKRKPCKS